METKLFLGQMAGKTASLKRTVSELSRAAFKSFGAARVADPPSRVSKSGGPIRRPPQKPNGLVRHTEFSPRQYNLSARTRSQFQAYDERMGMEASMMTLPFDRANALSNFAMVSLVAGLLLTIASTIALIWLSGVKSRYVDAHMAQIFAQSEQARAEAARANERAAEFLLRAQQANTEQEKARLQLEKVRTLSAARRISAEQHAKIVKSLSGHTMTVNLLSPNNDIEAAQFADDIAQTLKEAGVTVNASTSLFPIPIRGLGMSMSSSETGKMLYLAFRGAGFDIKDLPEKDPVMIIVGVKASVF